MLTIGEFSRLSRVSARMLRHYDALGLLTPEMVGENGYRYYRQEQLADIGRIERLKGYGFQLAEIKELLPLGERELTMRLHQRRRAAYQELNAQRELLRRLEADILRMEETVMNQNKYQVILMEDPEQQVFAIRRQTGVEGFHALFLELRERAAALGLCQAGPIQVRYFNEEFDCHHTDVEAQMVVARQTAETTVKPACLCAAVMHQGAYEGLYCAYDALCAWLAGHPEYRVCGPALERYMNDPHQVSSPDELLTGVMFPVEKV